MLLFVPYIPPNWAESNYFSNTNSKLPEAKPQNRTRVYHWENDNLRQVHDDDTEYWKIIEGMQVHK